MAVVFDAEALYVALDAERRAHRLQWRDIAARAGVSASTLTRLGHGGKPNADGLVRLMAWLNVATVTPFTRTVPTTSPPGGV